MKQVNLKSDRVAVLLEQITQRTGETNVDAVTRALEYALASERGAERSKLARDVFSLLHFPMLCGVIAYAFVIEEVVAHPGEPLTFEGRLALAFGLMLFIGGAAIAVRRATHQLMLPRVLLLIGTVAAVIALVVTPWLSLTIAFAGVALIALLEQWQGNSA